MAEEFSSEPTAEPVETAPVETEAAMVATRGRGRPSGSKNKPKAPVEETEAVPVAPKPAKAQKPTVQIETTPVVTEAPKPKRVKIQAPPAPPDPPAAPVAPPAPKRRAKPEAAPREQAMVDPPSPRSTVRTASQMLKEMQRQHKRHEESYYAGEIAKFMR